MKATLTKSDLRGTVAVEMTAETRHSLQVLMEEYLSGFDTARYYCRGCQLDWEAGRESVALRFACFDKQERKYVLFRTDDLPLTVLPALLSRVQVVMGVEMQEVWAEETDETYLPRK